MKPKAQNEHDDGLLEYLEDIIGTAKYKQPIEDAAKEVESLNEVCLEKSNRVAIVEKEKDNLEVLTPFLASLSTGSKNDCIGVYQG
jgi:structural maintenance of chromosome 4